MSSYLAFQGLTAARKRFADLAGRLREAASGAVMERAVEKIQEQVQAVARRLAAKHKDTGAAASALVVTGTPGLVQLKFPRYLGYHAWWVFRSGMPPFIVTRAAKILAAELDAVLAGQASPLALADAAAEETAAEKSRAKFKADVARIYRQSAAGKLARKLARKAAT